MLKLHIGYYLIIWLVCVHMQNCRYHIITIYRVGNHLVTKRYQYNYTPLLTDVNKPQ